METSTRTIPRLKPAEIGQKGVWMAMTVLLSWLAMLTFLLQYTIDWRNPLVYVFVLIQMHLYTGVFITAHDAIHGVVAPHNKRLNETIGTIATFLFAFNSYKKLSSGHHLHHKHAATDYDPDFHRGNANFILWFLNFAFSYVSIWQVLAMAGTYNLLKLWFPMENVIAFWMIPVILSTFQLFIFGTYLPHRGDHDQDAAPHNARSQPLNHVRAFLSCYFFGYHFEHHAYPYLPWWQLPKAREVTTPNPLNGTSRS